VPNISRVIYAVTPDLVISENVAIVGSAGKLKNTEYGELIDQFDDVVRFNRAPTEGYEELVGGKTTLRVTNNHVFNNNQEDPTKWTKQPRYFIRDLRNTRVLYIGPDYEPWFNRAQNVHESVDAYLYSYEAGSVLKECVDLKSDKNLTVGMGFISLCVYSGITPHLFGFSTDPADPRDHYWEDRPPAGPCHDISEEKKVLIKLASEGRIILH